jgi:hypothetical protein
MEGNPGKGKNRRKFQPGWRQWLIQIGLLLAVFLAAAWFPAAAAGQELSARQEPDCQTRLDTFLQTEDWTGSLLDPVLTSPEEIEERLAVYAPLHRCLDIEGPGRSPEKDLLHQLLEYFLIFAGGYQTPDGGSELYLVDLSLSDDPGVQQLRDEAGLPPPPGYVFVRTYRSRADMPPRVREIFGNPEVAGVAIYTRYIAVLDEQQGSLQQELLRRETLPRTVSHELIHAYVHSVVQVENLGRLPQWYNEGLAIYFSGSGEHQTLMTPGSVLVYTTTADYRQYRDNFRYLEARLGRERLLELIRQSVEQVEPELLLRKLGMEDERILQLAVRGWRENQVRRGQAVSLVGVVLFGLLVLWMVPAGYTCECGYHAHKKAFRSGRCPKCRRPVDLSLSPARRQPRSLWRTCQACGRTYWLWNTEKVRRPPHGTSLWVEASGGLPLEEPEKLPVQAICDDCCQRADELAEVERQRLAAEAEVAREAARLVYAAWLDNAPRVTAWFQDNLEVYTPTQALELLVSAATLEEEPAHAPQAGSPHPSANPLPDPGLPPAPIRLRVFPGGQVDFRRQAPAGYENVLVRRVMTPAWHGELVFLGTVRRLPDERIAIHWVQQPGSFQAESPETAGLDG